MHGLTRVRRSLSSSGWIASLAAAPLLLFALSGCASDYGGAINGQRALSPEEQRLQAVEGRLTDLSRRFNALDAAQRNGQSSDEMRGLRGQIEQMRHDVDELMKAQAQNADFDQRLKRLESGGATAAPTDPSGAAPGVPASAPVLPAPGAALAPPPAASASADEEAAYLRSFDQLKAGKYDDAIHGFQGMLAKYPQGNYADNAWYWMGKSYYVGKHDYANALKSYQSLLRSFPSSPKVPDGLLETGSIYQDQQQKEQARSAYNQLLKSYPGSPAAAQARTRLAQLK